MQGPLVHILGKLKVNLGERYEKNIYHNCDFGFLLLRG